MINAYGAFQTFYQLQLLNAETSSDIAWIGSTQAFLPFLVSMVAGPLFDAGHLRSLLWVGSGLLVVGKFLVSITHQYWQVFHTQALSKILPNIAMSIAASYNQMSGLAWTEADTGCYSDGARFWVPLPTRARRGLSVFPQEYCPGHRCLFCWQCTR